MITIPNKNGDNLGAILGMDEENVDKMADEFAGHAAKAMKGFVEVLDQVSQDCEKYKEENGGGFEQAMKDGIDKAPKDYFEKNINQGSTIPQFYDIVSKYTEDETHRVILATDFSCRLFFAYKEYMEEQNKRAKLEAMMGGGGLGALLANAL